MIKFSALALAHIGGIMTEGIPKCPRCGNEPEVRRLLICGTKVVRCVPCAIEMPPDAWKQYCAAMDLAKWNLALRRASENDPRVAEITEKLDDAEQRVEELLNA